MSALLTALSAQVGNAVFVYLESGNALTGTLSSVASDLTVFGSYTVDSTKIVGFST